MSKFFTEDDVEAIRILISDKEDNKLVRDYLNSRLEKDAKRFYGYKDKTGFWIFNEAEKLVHNTHHGLLICLEEIYIKCEHKELFQSLANEYKCSKCGKTILTIGA